MNYNIFAILNINPQSTIGECVDAFYQQLNLVIDELQNDLENFSIEKQIYTYPTSNVKLAKKIKLLIIVELFIINSFVFSYTVMCLVETFVKNNKLSTLDVCVYFLVFLNELLERTKQNKWKDNYLELVTKIDNLEKNFSKILNFSFVDLKNLKISNEEIGNLLLKNK